MNITRYRFIFTIILAIIATAVFVLIWVLQKKSVIIKNNAIQAQESSCLSVSEQVKNKTLQDIFSFMPHPVPVEKAAKLMEKEEFLCDIKNVLRHTPRDLLILVDKKHNIESYAPDDLVYLDNYADVLTLTRSNLQLRLIVISDLREMAQAALADSITLPISSAYRSYEYQKNVFARHVQNIGKKQALRESARAGTSQHQLGLAIDFGSISPAFGNTASGKWLRNNAWKYGFSLSYPENQEAITGYIFESWHYRYIGKVAAAFEQKYFKNDQQRLIELLQHREALLAL